MSKSLAIITGASRGIGRAIAVALAEEGKVRDDKLHMVLLARSIEKLNETATLVKTIDSEVTTSCHEIDLSDMVTLPENLQEILEPLSSTIQYDSCLLINNAGSVGPLGTCESLSNIEELQQSINLNITSSIWVSSQFTKTFANKCPMVRIVNISSICAIDPFSTMGVYCAGKSARDMFHKVLAKEYSEDYSDKSTAEEKQQFKVLNWAPGPCDTEMTDVLAQSPVIDNKLHDYFESSKHNNTLVKPKDSAKKLVELLRNDTYESGAHIDYYDV